MIRTKYFKNVCFKEKINSGFNYDIMIRIEKNEISDGDIKKELLEHYAGARVILR